MPCFFVQAAALPIHCCLALVSLRYFRVEATGTPPRIEAGDQLGVGMHLQRLDQCQHATFREFLRQRWLSPMYCAFCQVDGVQPMVTIEDCIEAEEIFQNDANVQRLCRERYGIEDIRDVVCDPWYYGKRFSESFPNTLSAPLPFVSTCSAASSS